MPYIMLLLDFTTYWTWLVFFNIWTYWAYFVMFSWEFFSPLALLIEKYMYIKGKLHESSLWNVFFRKGILKSEAKILEICLGRSSFFDEVADCSSATLIKVSSFINIFERFWPKIDKPTFTNNFLDSYFLKPPVAVCFFITSFFIIKLATFLNNFFEVYFFHFLILNRTTRITQKWRRTSKSTSKNDNMEKTKDGEETKKIRKVPQNIELKR